MIIFLLPLLVHLVGACLPSGGGLLGGGCGGSSLPTLFPSSSPPCGSSYPSYPQQSLQSPPLPPLPPPPSPIYLSPTAVQPLPQQPHTSFSTDASPQHTWSIASEQSNQANQPNAYGSTGGTYSVIGVNTPDHGHDEKLLEPSIGSGARPGDTSIAIGNGAAYDEKPRVKVTLPKSKHRRPMGESRLKVGNGTLPASYFQRNNALAALPPAPPTSDEFEEKSHSNENPSVLVAAENKDAFAYQIPASYQELEEELKKELGDLELSEITVETVKKALLAKQRIPLKKGKVNEINKEAKKYLNPIVLLPSSTFNIDPSVTEVENGKYVISHQALQPTLIQSTGQKKKEEIVDEKPNTQANLDENTFFDGSDTPRLTYPETLPSGTEQQKIKESHEKDEQDDQVQVPSSTQVDENEEKNGEQSEKEEENTLKAIVSPPKSSSYGIFAVRTHLPEKDYPEYLTDEMEQTVTPYLTYYNQICDGKQIYSSPSETMTSAAEKCAEVGCEAANARPIGEGKFEITFLRGITQRRNQHGTYCVSGKKIPLKMIRRAMSRKTFWPARGNLRIRRLLSSPYLRHFRT